MKIVVMLAAGWLLCSAGAFAQESLTWDDCLREAHTNNPDLVSADAVVVQQKAARQVTKSGLFPQIKADAGASRSQTSSQAKTVTTDSYSYGASASQLVFDGLKTPNQVKAAGETLNAAQAQYRFTSSEVRLRLRTAFVGLLKAQESLQVAKGVADKRRGDLELITLRYQSGLEHKGAVMNAEASLAQAQFEIRQFERAEILAQRQLTKEMGRTAFVPLTASGELAVSGTYTQQPDFETIARNHPSTLQAAAKKNAAGFNLKAAYADYFPQLTADAGAGKSGTHWTPRTNDWNMGLALSLPLFEGGLRRAQVSQAKAVLTQTTADERSTRDGIVVALQDAWDVLLDAIDTVDVQRKTLDAAQERARIAEAQYATGFITYDNWSIIEDNLVQAQRSYVDARGQAALAEAAWIQAKGDTLEYAKK